MGSSSFLSEAAQVAALGPVLSQQAVGVLVDAALPGAMRVGEIHLHPGVFPIVAALAGLGIGAVLDWLSKWRDLKRLAVVLLCAALGVTVQGQVAEFFCAERSLGRMHGGGNTQLRRVDSGVAELIVNDGQSYILPLSNYADSVIKYLTSKRALQVRSAVDADGALMPVLRQGAVRLVMPLEDDEQSWRGNPAQWVLFEGATAYILPPRMDLTALFPV